MEEGQEKVDSKEFGIVSFGYNDLDITIMSSGYNFSKYNVGKLFQNGSKFRSNKKTNSFLLRLLISTDI